VRKQKTLLPFGSRVLKSLLGWLSHFSLHPDDDSRFLHRRAFSRRSQRGEFNGNEWQPAAREVEQKPERRC
jgi:hypothetical protein